MVGRAYLLTRLFVFTSIAAFAGCASTLPPPAPGIAETDATLASPMRPKVETKRKWFDFENILDPRSRDIESHLGF